MPTRPWHEKPLWEKVFMSGDKVYMHAGHIIGHLGVSPLEFFDRAKLLSLFDQRKFENAVRDLTVYSVRESPNPRYELHPQAKKTLRIIIGPEPTDLEYASWWRGRLISVQLEREAGREVLWGHTPPVPLEPLTEEIPAEEPPKRKARKKVK
jgi:hypothetical protein